MDEVRGSEERVPSERQPAQRATSGDVDSGVQPLRNASRIASKEYYSIGEVCEITDLKPHVLRYWESQFRLLNPSKNRAGNRAYRRKDIQLVQLVKHLLYTEKFTIEGAKQKLDEIRRGKDTGIEMPPPVEDARHLLLSIKRDLDELNRKIEEFRSRH